jgi:hypothetical protein
VLDIISMLVFLAAAVEVWSATLIAGTTMYEYLVLVNKPNQEILGRRESRGNEENRTKGVE